MTWHLIDSSCTVLPWIFTPSAVSTNNKNSVGRQFLGTENSLGILISFLSNTSHFRARTRSWSHHIFTVHPSAILTNPFLSLAAAGEIIWEGGEKIKIIYDSLRENGAEMCIYWSLPMSLLRPKMVHLSGVTPWHLRTWPLGCLPESDFDLDAFGDYREQILIVQEQEGLDASTLLSS